MAVRNLTVWTDNGSKMKVPFSPSEDCIYVASFFGMRFQRILPRPKG